jgi:histidinol-phosphate phosphatase family protein
MVPTEASPVVHDVPPSCAVNAGTTVFLDRDGVVNRRVEGDYVRSWAQLEPRPGAIDAVAALTLRARRVVVVTNQRCVALGIVSREDLEDMHARLAHAVAVAGGRLGGVLVCPHGLEDRCGCRKPAPGLVLEAARRWPDVALTQAVLVGDSESDLRCAAAASPSSRPIGRVWVGTSPAPTGPAGAHTSNASLAEFVAALGPDVEEGR